MSTFDDTYKPEVRIRKSGVPPWMPTKLDIQKQVEAREIRIEKTRPIQDYLTNKVPMQSDKLKVRLLNEGVLENKCHICKESEWEGKKIPLELDHIDGDHGNNRIKNLRLVCPNCHAQTSTYRVKKQGAKSAREMFGE